MRKNIFCILLSLSFAALTLNGCGEEDELAEEDFEEEYEEIEEVDEFDFSTVSFLTDQITLFGYPLDSWDLSTLSDFATYYQKNDTDVFEVIDYETDEKRVLLIDHAGNVLTVEEKNDGLVYSFNINETEEIPQTSFIACSYDILNKNSFLKYYSTFDVEKKSSEKLEWPDDYSYYEAFWISSENDLITFTIEISPNSALIAETPYIELAEEEETEVYLEEEPQYSISSVSIYFLGRSVLGVDPAELFRSLGGEIEDDGEGSQFGYIEFDDDELSGDYSVTDNSYSLCFSDYSDSGAATINIYGDFGGSITIEYSECTYSKGNMSINGEVKDVLKNANGEDITAEVSGYTLSGFYADEDYEISLTR